MEEQPFLIGTSILILLVHVVTLRDGGILVQTLADTLSKTTARAALYPFLDMRLHQYAMIHDGLCSFGCFSQDFRALLSLFDHIFNEEHDTLIFRRESKLSSRLFHGGVELTRDSLTGYVM